jgi:hypothetical protein
MFAYYQRLPVAFLYKKVAEAPWSEIEPSQACEPSRVLCHTKPGGGEF